MIEFLNTQINITFFQASLLALATAYLTYRMVGIPLKKAAEKEDNRKNLLSMALELNGILNLLISSYKQCALPKENLLKSIKFLNSEKILTKPGPCEQKLKYYINNLPNAEQLQSTQESDKKPNEELNKKKEILNCLYNDFLLEQESKRPTVIDEELRKFITLEACKIHTDLNKLSFVIDRGYNGRIYESLILCIQHLESLQEVTKNLNKFINEEFKYTININKNSQEYNNIINNLNEGFIEQTKRSIAFVNITQKLIIDLGKEKFGYDFTIGHEGFDDYNDSKYIGYLPESFQYLREKPKKGKVPLWIRIKIFFLG